MILYHKSQIPLTDTDRGTLGRYGYELPQQIQKLKSTFISDDLGFLKTHALGVQAYVHLPGVLPVFEFMFCAFIFCVFFDLSYSIF